MTRTAPAQGERRAMTGYLPQYELAAWAILRHLRDQTLESIRLGDAGAGRVDDFVILSPNAIDGHSVKWSESRDTVTFRDFTKARDNAPCWIAQLADGWKRLRTSHPNRRVTVHFVTCDIQSKNDVCPGTDKKPFASFYHEAWIPFQDDGQAISEEWKPAWEEWQRDSGLDTDDFEQFTKDCRLDFHARTAADRTFISRDDALLSSQLKKLAAELANIVRDPSRQVELSKEELLKRVGWSHLIEFKHRHEFPIRDPYEPIDSTVDELAAKLDTVEGGYLALLGSPGSGKSTLLTRTLEARLNRHRLVKYYAFVPGSADPRTRGESVNFLHDLVLSLERAGFTAGQSQGIFDRALLLDRLHQQLQKLGTDFLESGFPTVILIDGLDHIPREQNPQQSLIGDLPLPDQIPAGVVIVLGSQTDDLPGLPPSVRQSIQEVDRRIQIGPMSKNAVLKVIAGTNLSISLTTEQQEQIAALAGGHPLALSLLLNGLRTAASGEQVTAALADTIAFTGDVDEYYFAHWQQIESLQNLAGSLALLARIRRPIDLDWVASWQPAPPLAELRRRFGHLFREERPNHWVFFHNSFRQYVIEKSAALKGGTNEAADRAYHLELAAICKTSGVPHSWEVVYHLAMAREAKSVLELATPEYFREQLNSLRPLESISRDARYVAAAAGQMKDAIAIVESTLFLSELSQREFSLSAWKIGGLLLSMGFISQALEYLWEGTELQISEAEALRVARDLFISGNEPLARRVFDAAEPFSLLQPAGEGEVVFGRDASDVLQQWAKAAALFRPIDEVVALIKGFVPPKSRMGETLDQDKWQANLCYWSAGSMERLGRMAEVAVVEECLHDLEGEQPYLSVWLLIHRFREYSSQGKVAEAKAIVDELLRSPSFLSFPDHAKLLIAQGALTLLGDSDTAAEILRTVSQPSISLDGIQEPSFSEAMEAFRFYRLLMLVGGDVTPSAVVPDPSKEDDWPRVLLERALVQLARVSAHAARGRVYTAVDVRQELYQPLRLFQRTIKERRRWHGWYRVERLRNDYDELIVDVVQEHGPIAIEGLRTELERLWAAKETAWVWKPEARRNVVMALYDAGASEEWTRAQLESIASTMLDGKDITGKVDECEAQAKAWRTLGDNQKSVEELKRLVSVSFGVGYRKDYQMDHWVEWLNRVLALEPDKVGKRISLFAASIAATEETTEGRGTRSAALALIESCVSVSPRRAVALIHWFEKYGCIDHASAVATLLHTASEKRHCRSSVLKAAYIEFLLVFSTDTHAELAQAILKQFAEGVSIETSTSACKEIASAIKVRGLPTSRLACLSALKETAISLGLPLAECDLDSVPPQVEQDESHERTVKLKDGTILSEQAVNERASTVDSLIELVTQSNESYYRWRNVVDALLPKLSRADAVRLVQSLPPEFDESLTLSSISRRLTELGERVLAWQLGERALDSSPIYGWAKHADGGTRAEAIRALVAANGTVGRERALQVVADDLSAEAGLPYDLARCLIDIIPLLRTDLEPETFYPLVEDYVKILSSPLHLLDEATDELAANPGDDDFEQALCELLTFHMSEPVPVLAQCAMRAMLEILLGGSTSGERCVRKMLAGTEIQQVAAVGLVEVLAVRSIDAVRPYESILRGFVLAKNWWVAKTAQRLCTELDVQNLPQRAFAVLPSIYMLALPPIDDNVPPVSADEPLPDSDNPRDMVRPYDFHLKMMAEMAGLEEQNLFVAAVCEMKQIANVADLTAQDEMTYRSHLERAGLKLPFRRKRGAVAREAMRRVATDLVDGRRVHPRSLGEFLGLVTSSDPQLALVDPTQRPLDIRPLEGFNEYHSNAAEWTSNAAPTFENHVRAVAGMVVLGEETKLKVLDWSTPKEIRVSLVGQAGLTALDADYPFERVFETQLAAYANTSKDDAANPLIVKNQWVGADTDGADWIALNPYVAKKHSWTLAQEGLFRWTNDAGEVMVETVWWKDGCIQLPPYERDCEVGEGFLVIASPSAFAQILSLLNEPTRYLLVRRSCVSDHQVIQAEAVRTNEHLAMAPP